MDEIVITVTGAQACLTAQPLLTAGMVGLPVRFVFDETWDGLRKTAVFRAGGMCISCTDLEQTAQVPWEVMEKSGCTLTVGVYGSNQDGSRVIPTLWAEVGVIQPGTDPQADPGAAPALPIWQLALDTARQAREVAQSVREDADSGRFDGQDYRLTPEDKGKIADMAAENLDMSAYLKRTDYASASQGGTVKVNGSYGLDINAGGSVSLVRAGNGVIDNRADNFRVIVPSNLDYAVKSGVVRNALELTPAEQAAAQSWLGIDRLIQALREELNLV